MPSIQSTWDFNGTVSSAMGWTFTPGVQASGAWSSLAGSPTTGCLFSKTSGSGVNTTNYWSKRGSFNALFTVPTTRRVISIGAAGDDFKISCATIAGATGSAYGPFQLLSSGSSVIITTLFAQTTFPSSFAWATKALSSVNISALNKSGADSAVLRMAFKHTHSGGSSNIYFTFDTVRLTCEYSTLEGQMGAHIFRQTQTTISTVAKELMQIQTNSSVVLEIHQAKVSFLTTLAEQVAIGLAIAITTGVVGTTLTPVCLSGGSTCQSTGYGIAGSTNATGLSYLDSQIVNTYNGYEFFPTPELRPRLKPGQRVVLRTDATHVTDYLTECWIKFTELGNG